MGDEDDAGSQIAALLRQYFPHQDEGNVAVAHREEHVDKHHQDEGGPAETRRIGLVRLRLIYKSADLHVGAE